MHEYAIPPHSCSKWLYSQMDRKRIIKYEQQIGGVGLGQGMHGDAGNENIAVHEGGNYCESGNDIRHFACSV